MPFRLRVLPSSRLTFTVVYGKFSAVDVRQHTEQLMLEKGFEPNFRQFLDFSAVADVAFSADDVRWAAAQTPFAREAKRVIFIPHDFGYGMGRMYQARAADQRGEILVTRDEEEGWRFLGLAPDSPERADFAAFRAETLSA